ncbi:MAG: mechanosensitive ion channel family protein [Sediminibacterium sp.]
MHDELSRVLFGNTLLSYLYVAAGITITWIVWKLTRRSLIRTLKKITANTKTTFDDLLVEAADKFAGPFLYLTVNYAIICQLQFTPSAEKILGVAVMMIIIYFAVRVLNFTIHHLIMMGMKAKNESEQRMRQVEGLLMVLKVIVWGVGLVMFVDNLGYNVTTIIAGLGVGGIAIALAAQSILADLFSYIVIFFDKPFEIGDFIISGNFSGVVEKIGIKTSNIRSLDGQQLVIPNTELVKSVIQNYKRLERRRVIFSLGIVYQTSAELLRSIPPMIREIIDKEEHVSFDRANFKSFGDFSINYEIVYFIASPDYNLYMNTQEEICLKILEEFRKRNIEFAFPTQTVFLNRQMNDLATGS